MRIAKEHGAGRTGPWWILPRDAAGFKGVFGHVD